MTAADTTPTDSLSTDSLSTDSMSTDDRALELRRQGKALKTIAAELGLERAIDANAAFNRALRRRPPDEQATLRSQEEGRLNAIADSVRRNETLSQDELDRRLRSVDRLRAALTNP